MCRTGTQPYGVSSSRSPRALGGALAVFKPQNHIEAANTVDKPGDHTAVREPFEVLGHRLRLQAVERGARVVDHDVELRNAHLLFDLQVGQAFDAREAHPESFGRGAQAIEVFAKEFDGDLGAHAGQHVVEPVRDGLPDIERDRQHRQARAQIGDDGVLAAPAFFEVDLNFRGMDAFGVLIQFGATGAPAHGFHLGHAQDQLLGNQTDSV